MNLRVFYLTRRGISDGYENRFSTCLLHINALTLNRRELASSCVQPPLPCACSLLCGKRPGAWWSCRQEERGANHC